MFFFLSLIAFSPSFELTDTQFEFAANLEIEDEVKPGSLVVLPHAEGYPSYSINGVPFTIKDSKQYAVASVYGGPLKILRAEVGTSYRLLQGIFFHPVRRVLERSVFVDHEPLNSGNELRLPSSLVKKLESANDRQKQKDRWTLWSALDGDAIEPVAGCMQKPVDSKITSLFGRPRTLPSGRSYYHSGVDLRARTGVPIKSTLEGKVVFAGPMLVPGNNVILSHGGGLFSRYLHLSKINVKLGDRIPASTVVGLAGATGRVEAAHLHWEMIWKGQYANPMKLLEDWNQVCL